MRPLQWSPIMNTFTRFVKSSDLYAQQKGCEDSYHYLEMLGRVASVQHHVNCPYVDSLRDKINSADGITVNVCMLSEYRRHPDYVRGKVNMANMNKVGGYVLSE